MRSFLKSFVYAGEGIWNTILSQRNFRFHIAAMIYVTAFSFFYDLSGTEYCVLMLTFASVLACELINTALENAVDLCSKEYSDIAKAAKDAASGAVLVSAVFAVIVGIILFFDIDVMKNIVRYYSESIASLIGLAVSFPAAAVFVFGTGKHSNERKEHGNKK